jgi:hypothetical protein
MRRGGYWERNEWWRKIERVVAGCFFILAIRVDAGLVHYFWDFFKL